MSTPPEPGRTLLDVARDLQELSDRHAPALRREGLDDMAEQLERLAVEAESGAQELGAALSAPPGPFDEQVSPAPGDG